jgi:hypothetical protein
MEQIPKEEGQQPLKTNLSPALVKGKLSLDMTRVHGNYNQTLKKILEFEVTDDNFEEAQKLLKTLVSFMAYVEDHRTEEGKPFLEAKRVVDGEHKAFSKPLEEAKVALQQKVNVVGRRKELEAQKAKQEQDRILAIGNSINQFILDSSVKIASATTTEQLLQIERLINLEKANKARYQDHLPLLTERSNELTAKIKEQKEVVRELERIEAEKKLAEATGDDTKVQELLEKSELLNLRREENTLLVQETAAKSTLLTEIVAPEIDMPNTRYKKWKFEIVDPKEVMKKNPDLLKVELDFKKTSVVLNTLKDAGVLNGKTEHILNGIRYFEDKNF